jgi:phosphohistidine phosphatase SixA
MMREGRSMTRRTGAMAGTVVVAGLLLAGCAGHAVTPAAPAPLATADAPVDASAARPAWDAVLLVRHAEKESAGRDPGLTELGRRRALALADQLADAGITAVLSSPYARTRQTAAPIAARLGLEVETYDPRDIGGLAAALAARPGRLLVVGHSNTTPALAAALGGDPGSPIDDASEFDRLYVLDQGPAGVRTMLLRSAP